MKLPHSFPLASLATLTLLLAHPSIHAQSALPQPVVSKLSASSAASILPVTRKADAILSINPDHANWTYAVGEKASFHIKFDLKPYPAAGVTIKYKLGPENREGAEKTAVVPAGGLLLPVSALTEPGFIRCIVTANVSASGNASSSGSSSGSATASGATESSPKALTESATIAFSPELIVPTQSDPADFDSFWASQKAALAAIPPDYQLTPAPELSNAELDVSYLSFQNVSGGGTPSRIYGVLSVPRGAGPFPALLNVPGAGVRPYSGNRAMAAKGVITLQIGIHGIPVNLPKELYDQLGRGALDNYPRYGLDDRNSYYYRRVYLGALRASEYLTTHPQWDGKNLIVAGGSQGGQLTIVTSALNPRVTAIAPSYPAFSDVSGYFYGRTGGWPALFRKTGDGKILDAPVEPKLLTTSYYDTVNFARRIKVPGFYSWGYNDNVTPPTSTFSVYNIVTAPKQLTIAPEMGHASSAEQSKLIDAWILQQFSLNK